MNQARAWAGWRCAGAEKGLGCGGSAVARGLGLVSKLIAPGGRRQRRCGDWRRVGSESYSDAVTGDESGLGA